jgi:hypothetical protein
MHPIVAGPLLAAMTYRPHSRQRLSTDARPPDGAHDVGDQGGVVTLVLQGECMGGHEQHERPAQTVGVHMDEEGVKRAGRSSAELSPPGRGRAV